MESTLQGLHILADVAVSLDAHIFHGPRVHNKCSVCMVSRSPQWRAGWPLLDAPTVRANLCNACGLKYIKLGKSWS